MSRNYSLNRIISRKQGSDVMLRFRSVS
jgi:hypothetical protein